VVFSEEIDRGERTPFPLGRVAIYVAGIIGAL
jgi:hypothetical protein